MTGKTKRLLFIFMKLCLLMGVFIFTFVYFCNPSKLEIVFYIFAIFCISFLNLAYCYVLLDIKFQNKNIKKQVKKKLNNFERVEDAPIYYISNQKMYANILLDYFTRIVILCLSANSITFSRSAIRVLPASITMPVAPA